MSEDPATSLARNEARGRCMCASVQFVARLPSRFCAHCHCESCRRSHSAGFVTWIGFAAEQVEVVAGHENLVDFASSADTLRSFCRICGTKLFFRSGRWAGETHVALAAFDDPVDRAPSGHAFFEEHVAWIPWPRDVA
ncbi:MAG: GFA family protein [Betaproteobacteria bacterium]